MTARQTAVPAGPRNRDWGYRAAISRVSHPAPPLKVRRSTSYPLPVAVVGRGIEIIADGS